MKRDCCCFCLFVHNVPIYLKFFSSLLSYLLPNLSSSVIFKTGVSHAYIIVALITVLYILSFVLLESNLDFTISTSNTFGFLLAFYFSPTYEKGSTPNIDNFA